MTPQMEKAMQLQDGPTTQMEGYEALTGDPVTVDVDRNAEAMAMAMREMMANGPTRPTHEKAPTMTRAELAQQKAREAAGLPSNLTEANRVLALESKVDKLVDLLTIFSQGQTPSPAMPPDTSSPPPGPSHPAVIPAKRSSRSANLLTDPSTYLDEAFEAPLGVHPEAPEIEEPDDWVENLPESPPPPVCHPFEALANALTERTKTFLAGKDSSKFFRALLANGIHKNVGYTGWPAAFRVQFDRHFRDLLTNERFVRDVCEKVVRFSNGPSVSEKGAASLVTAMAGFISLYLAKVE
jgi:hypothetical protein